jgi:hypothetical protein
MGISSTLWRANTSPFSESNRDDVEVMQSPFCSLIGHGSDKEKKDRD